MTAHIRRLHKSLPLTALFSFFLANGALTAEADKAAAPPAAPVQADSPEKTAANDEFSRLEKLCLKNWTDDNIDERIAGCTEWLEKFGGKNQNAFIWLNRVGSYRVHESLSYAYYRKRSYNEAIAAADKALEFEKGFALAYFCRGASKLHRSLEEEALQDLTISLKIEEQPWTRLKRGVAYHELDKHDEALLDFNVVEKTENLSREYQLEMLERRAVTYIELKKPDSAVGDYLQLSKLDPQNVKWDLELAEVYKDQKKDALALEAANRVLVFSPEETDAYDLRAKIYAESADAGLKNVDKAIAELLAKFAMLEKKKKSKEEKLEKELATEESPATRKRLDESRAKPLWVPGSDYSELAELYASKGEYKVALEWIDRKISETGAKEDYFSSHNYRNRSSYHLKLGDLTKALADAQKAVEIGDITTPQDTMDSSVHEQLAAVYIAQGELAKGLEYVASTWTSIEHELLGPVFVRKSLPEIKNAEDGEKLAKLLAGVKEKIPPRANDKRLGQGIDCLIGQSLERYDPEAALKVFAALTFDGACKFKAEARIYSRRRELAKVLAAYDAFLEIFTDSLDYFEARGDLHLAMNNPDKALADASRFHELKPRYGAGYRLKARVLEAKKDYAAAILAGEQMTKDFPKWAAGHAIVARSLLLQGKLDDAQTAALKAVELSDDQDRADNLHVLGRIQAAKGLQDDAAATFIKAANFPRSTTRVSAYQYGLKTAGLYEGEIDGVPTAALDAALAACVRKPGCSLDADI